MDEAKQPEEFTLVSEVIGGLPIINHVIDRLRLPELLAQALPAVDGRVKLAPAVLIRVIVTNLVLGREPLYGLGEWAARFEAALLGLRPEEVSVVNDDRAGRALDALFDADRGSFLTTVVLRAMSEFGVDTHQLHNDSTSISVQGLFRGADGSPRGGKATPVVTFGHSKDHRPDLKQLVWILTVSSDGAVPILYRLANGNTSDVSTHIPTWDGLAELERVRWSVEVASPPSDLEIIVTVIENRDFVGKVDASAAAERMAAVGNMKALKASGAFDELMGQIDRGEIELDGKDGFIQHLIRAGLERGLKAELTEHLGYEKHEYVVREVANSRNGTYSKTVYSSAGDIDLAIPRDRAGTFVPRLVPKGSRHTGQLTPSGFRSARPWPRCCH